MHTDYYLKMFTVKVLHAANSREPSALSSFLGCTSFYFSLVFVELGMEPRISCRLSKQSTKLAISRVHCPFLKSSLLRYHLHTVKLTLLRHIARRTIKPKVFIAPQSSLVNFLSPLIPLPAYGNDWFVFCSHGSTVSSMSINGKVIYCSQEGQHTL